MTIQAAASEKAYLGDGIATVFAIPFPFDTAADLKITSTDASGNILTLSTGFTISGGAGSTGNATFTVAPASGVTITIYDNPALTQPTDYVSLDAFPAESHERALDRATRIAKRLYQLVQRSVRFPDGDVSTDGVLGSVANRKGKYLFFNAVTGAIEYAVSLVTTALSQSIIGQLLNPQTDGEISAGVTPTNYFYPPGDVRRFGAKADSGVTSNQLPFQNCLTANAGYFPSVIENTGSGYYGGFTTCLNVPAGTDLQFKNGARVVWASTTALSGPTVLGTACRPGLNITGNNVKISGQGSITGPTAPGVYVASEIGIVAVGTSAAAPFSNIEISSGVEITGWGSDGIELKWCTGVETRNCKIHDCGYAGTHYLTCNNIKHIGNETYNITPGSSGNAYGVSFSQDQSGGNITSSRTDANHMCIGVECAFNFIHDIPLWLGIDAHGLFDGNIHDNKVYNCWTGIQVASTPNAIGENNSISFNEVNILKYDGSATTVVATNPMGITVNGFSATVMHAGVRVVGNVISGYGNNQSPPTAFSIQASFMQGAVIADNIIRNWSGYGIYTTASDGGLMTGNVFGAVAAAYVNDACIQIQSGNSPWHISGNMHHITSGTAAHFGAVNNTGAAPDALFGVNDFVSAQTAQYGGAVGSTLSNIHFTGWKQPILSANTGTAGGVGYVTGAGGTVAQATSRTTGVTLNAPSGQITLFSVAGSATPATFTVTNNAVAATDTINLSQETGTDLYQLLVTNVQAGSFKITAFTTGGTTVEAPVINFNVVKGAAS